jgi:hypothetical protein
MEALLAFAAALLTLRLAGLLASRWRERRQPQLLAWSAGLAAYALGAGAIAWERRPVGTTACSGRTTSAAVS